jgi:hypothetical protein
MVWKCPSLVFAFDSLPVLAAVVAVVAEATVLT